MSSAVISESGFTLESLIQLNSSTLRVNYTDDPLQASDTGAHDALNPSQYILLGPNANSVSLATVVNGNTQSIDLYLSGQLLPGVWTLTVSSNIQTVLGQALAAPLSLSITVSAISAPPPLANGTTNSTAFSTLRKFLNPALKGNNWNALLTGLAFGDAYVQSTAVAAFDQLFTSSASAPYLDQRCNDLGVNRPGTMGMDDSDYSNLTIITTAYKTVESSIASALEIFYGASSTRANAISTLAEPYALQDGDQLLVTVDEQTPTLVINFGRTDFSQLGQASALEICAAITRGFIQVGSNAYAGIYTNPNTGLNYVQIFSPTLGLRGAIRIQGGRAQNVLQFPTLVATTQAIGTQWTIITTPTIANGLAPGSVRFTWAGGTNPSLQLVQVGDYASIFGTAFPASDSGSWTITNVTTSYFDVSLQSGAAGSVTQLNATDIMFYTPSKQNINLNQHVAAVVQTDTLDIILPATTQAVTRGINTGAYLHGNPAINIASGSRSSSGLMTITTATNHGLSSGGWVWLDGLIPNNSSLAAPAWTQYTEPTITILHTLTTLPGGLVLLAGGVTSGLSTVESTAYTFNYNTDSWTSVGPMNDARSGHTATLLQNGRVLIAGGDASTATTCEIYDPISNTWSTTGSLNTGRTGHKAVLLASGEVLVTGGAASDTSAEFYSPVTGAWTQVSSAVSVARTIADSVTASFEMVTLKDGRVLVIGGFNGTSAQTVCDLYTPTNNTWTKNIVNLQTARCGFRAVVTNTGTSGNILIVGGANTSFTPIATCELINPAAWTSSYCASLPMATFAFGMSTMTNGMLIVTGGYNAVNARATQIYDPILNTWISGPNTVNSHYGNNNSTLGNGYILTAGGNVNIGHAEVYSPYVGVAASGKLEGLYQILSTPTAAELTVQQAPGVCTLIASTGTVTSTEPADNGVQGPYVYDPISGVAITGTTTTTTQAIVQGSSYRVLNITSTAGFSTTGGYICLAFATQNQITPVKYLAVLSSTQLLLDPTYIFPISLNSGASVTWLAQSVPWVPANPAISGSCYITTTAAGRVAAEATVEAMLAAGFIYNVEIVYPGSRGLGNATSPLFGAPKLSDVVSVWGSDDLDSEIATLRAEV